MKTIYGLRELPDGPIRYVGCTGSSVDLRLKNHLSEAEVSKSPKSLWLREIKRPGWCILERCGDDEANWREQYWISALKIRGNELLNLAYSADGMTKLYEKFGGEVGLVMGEELMVRLMERGTIKGYWEMAGSS